MIINGNESDNSSIVEKTFSGSDCRINHFFPDLCLTQYIESYNIIRRRLLSAISESDSRLTPEAINSAENCSRSSTLRIFSAANGDKVRNRIELLKIFNTRLIKVTFEGEMA